MKLMNSIFNLAFTVAAYLCLNQAALAFETVPNSRAVVIGTSEAAMMIVQGDDTNVRHFYECRIDKNLAEQIKKTGNTSKLQPANCNSSPFASLDANSVSDAFFPAYTENIKRFLTKSALVTVTLTLACFGLVEPNSFALAAMTIWSGGVAIVAGRTLTFTRAEGRLTSQVTSTAMPQDFAVALPYDVKLLIAAVKNKASQPK